MGEQNAPPGGWAPFQSTLLVERGHAVELGILAMDAVCAPGDPLWLGWPWEVLQVHAGVLVGGLEQAIWQLNVLRTRLRHRVCTHLGPTVIA
eukprot:7469817-Lingulodinium_polyedra.AAC.1